MDARIAEIDSRDDERRYGSTGLILKRSRLHRALRDAATRHGIRVEHQKKLVDLEVGDRLDGGGRQVVAHFEDGTLARGDFLIGADGSTRGPAS